MSLSSPKLRNPCQKFIKFKGDTGVFQYWDKELKKNIDLKSPVRFIVLDELNTITGYSERSQSGIYSNEVRSLRDEDLNVRSFKGNGGLIGKYAEIKDAVAKSGGKFTKSVYVALIHKDDELELANFQLSGASFSGWVDKLVDVSLTGVAVNKCNEGKKGKVTYKIPVFEPYDVSRELMEKAFAMDRDLQKYLTEYLDIKKRSYNPHATQPASAKHPGDPAEDDEAAPKGNDMEDEDFKF